MILLDMRTVLLLGAFFEVICTFVFFNFWLNIRKRYQGIGYLLTFFIFSTIAWLLSALRSDYISDFFSMVVSNSLAIAGVFFTHKGLEHLVEKPTNRCANWFVLFIFPFVHSYFLYIKPSLTIRSLLLYIAIEIFIIQSLWLLLFGVDKKNHYLTKNIGVIYIFSNIICLSNIIKLIITPYNNADLLKARTIDTILIVVLQMLIILFIFEVILMINKGLLNNIEEQEEKYSKAFHYLPYGVLITKQSDKTIIEVNDSFCKMTNFENNEVLGKTVNDIHLWNNECDYVLVNNELILNGNVEKKELVFRKKSGEEFIGSYSSEVITINGEACALSTISDITERVHLEETIQHMADYDALTELPSLRYVKKFIISSMSASKHNGANLAILFIDIDGFKMVNDTYGHSTGDYVLQQIAIRLKQAVHTSDMVARLGGDEFLIVITDLNEKNAAGIIAEKVIRIISEPIYFEDYKIEVGASVGISIYPEDSEEIDQLITLADSAMYNIKKSGKNGYAYSTKYNFS